MKFTGLKGIVFDLDFTLYDEADYFMVVFDEFSKRNGSTIDFVKMRKWFYRVRPTSRDILKDFLKAGRFIGDIESLHQELFDIYCCVKRDIDPYEDVRETLVYFKKIGLKLGILTNGVVEAQRNKVKVLGLGEYFKSIIYARQCGKEMEKPHLKPFETIISALDESPASLLFVGDNPVNDLEPANRLGAMTVYMDRNVGKGSSRNTFVDGIVHNLREIRNLLKNAG